MVRVTVHDDFFNLTLTGEFATAQEAREFYAMELDTNLNDINIIKIEEVTK